MVHEGCGPVLEFRNDSLVRIDKSFLHQNQIGAATFVYKDEIYFWGGYGLFTYKNILTKYDFKAKEWFLVETENLDVVQPLTDVYSLVDHGYLYIYGGVRRANNPNYSNNNLVFRLNLKLRKWEQFHTDFFENFPEVRVNNTTFRAPVVIDGFNVVHSDTNSFLISPTKNNYIVYNSFFRHHIETVLNDGSRLYALTLNQNASVSKYIFTSFPFNNILKSPVSEGVFYYKTKPYYIYVAIALLLLGMLLVLYIKWSFILYLVNPKKPFQY